MSFHVFASLEVNKTSYEHVDTTTTYSHSRIARAMIELTAVHVRSILTRPWREVYQVTYEKGGYDNASAFLQRVVLRLLLSGQHSRIEFELLERFRDKLTLVTLFEKRKVRACECQLSPAHTRKIRRHDHRVAALLAQCMKKALQTLHRSEP